MKECGYFLDYNNTRLTIPTIVLKVPGDTATMAGSDGFRQMVPRHPFSGAQICRPWVRKILLSDLQAARALGEPFIHSSDRLENFAASRR